MTIVEDRPRLVAQPAPLPPSGTSDTSRWRLPARLARREVRRRPWRTVLVVLLIGVPVAGLVLGDIAYRTDQLPPDPARTFGAAAAQVVLFGDGVHTDLVSVLNDALPSPAADAQVLTWHEATLPLRTTDRPDEVAWTTVRTVDLSRALAAGLVRVEDGRVPRSADEVIVDRRAAETLRVGVGDRLSLMHPSQTFTVVGVAGGTAGLLVAPGFDVASIVPVNLRTVALLDEAAARVVLEHVWPAWVSTSFMFRDIGSSNDPEALVVGWLASVMLMAVLGIVVAAAFAVSGRRQLVCIGQLSANGADPVIVRRYLALQGTTTGVVAAVCGASAGVGAAHALRARIAEDGRLAVAVGDIVVLVGTAVVVATVAAVVPSRSLVRTSVLTALGGRRPVGPVRRRQVPIGLGLIAAGTAGLWVAVESASSVSGSGGQLAPMFLATVGGLAGLAGVCCVCPAVVDGIARLGTRGTGSVRLATRSLGRHRARSSALLAAVVATTAAGVAIGSFAEGELTNDALHRGQDRDARVIEVFSSESDTDGSDVGVPVAEDVRRSVERIVGPVRWVETRTALPASFRLDEVGLVPIVADPAVLDALGFDERERAEVASNDAVIIDPFADASSPTSWRGVLPGIDATVLVPSSLDVTQRLLISAATVDDLGLVVGVGTTFAMLDHELTRDEYDRLQDMSVGSNDAAYFQDVVDGPRLGFYVGFPTRDWAMEARLAIVATILILVLAVVAIGMALWAAEGRDERDSLVALGAPPGVLARSSALRAWLLATAGAVTGVPFSWLVVTVVAGASGTSATFPWFVVAGVVLVVPSTVAATTWVGSEIVQRVGRRRGVAVDAD